ncbi:unnamed protein product [Triticum aestivum]|uniref:LOB domain-containing protein n=3 Tax=Triticinae TaxID=1648030 RepID=A0A9R1ETY6_WHEAT|nr:LOB domain-containing protein 40 [Aegilops tauschii subsp. strangulata]XP_044332343.1 LOB domain-containing protein 40-like [Triticum aestivum]KAF7016110.1 hypothetical protein CFC21_029792 [Triticum aestivum]SPT18069.1 unnamed protein product [Triticum aestivum]
MRLSCNGCRVLRKGCSEDCSIRPCLQWIKSPEAQANATVFLAKFYGRAGLMNLINAGTDDSLRPGIFRSLLYEACGRIVNPIYGSVGLLWSNNWQMCQAAVEAVLSGKPIVQVSSEDAAADRTPPLKAYDIRHVSTSSAADGRLHKVAKPGRTRFKRASSASSHHNPSSDSNNKPQPQPRAPTAEEELDRQHRKEMQEGAFQRAPSHESSDSRHEDPVEPHCQQEASADTEAEAGSHVSQAEQEQEQSTEPAAEHAEEVEKEEDEELGLELTLGFAPVAARPAGFHLSVRTAAEPAFVGLRFL